MQEVMPENDCSGIQDTEVPFSNMVDMDSMDFLDVVMAIQKKYRIEIPDGDFGSLRTMKSTLDYLETKIK
ncbi:acyl carrier protein [Candidatus Magnetominusculus dajiuhuensis]|uniref:acyl carrier protein n=1 Tax=Candidatus Magnetominusculus dajiuhuensis TaxID=3137712 RepID=UPI003B43C3B8